MGPAVGPEPGHSRGEAAGEGQLVAPRDAPVLLPLDPCNGSRRFLGGYFVPGEGNWLQLK